MYAQSDRGTITGTVSDPAGAMIPGAALVATNPETGVEFHTLTTNTGNYTIPNVPSGTYDINVEMSGFRQYLQKGVTVQVATTSRVDIVMQVGSTTESVTVTADAPLLKSESAEQSTTLTGDRINGLPLNFATGAGAVRNPLMFVQLAPGTSVGGWNDIRVNGAPSNTFRIIFEGQDTTSALNPRVSDESQPSVEAIQEFTLQTSNFSAEFGQVSGGLFNFTSRSGTNQYHGSAYEYLAHEALGAGRPFSDDGQGHLVRPQIRRHDFGGSFGGPVWIPKLYSGKDRTFFFFNYEMFRDRQNKNDGFGTVPTNAFREGNFSAALTGRVLGQDPLNRNIMEGAIYDAGTQRSVNGQVVRDPFPGNTIPMNRFDPVALKIQSLIPAPASGALVNNFEKRYSYRKIQAIPSIKVDHNFTPSSKLAGYYSQMRTDKDNGQDGLPDPVSARRDQFIRSYTVRVTYDHTLRPTLLLHMGAGYQRYHNPDSAPPSILEFDAANQLGLKGTAGPGFPRITGVSGGTPSNAAGGLGFNIGPSNRNLYLQDKPTAVSSLTWIRGSHSYKFGGEWRIDTFTNIATNGVAGNIQFGPNETALPYLQATNPGGGYIGHPYASFLLGLASQASISNAQNPQYRRTAWGFFAQDTWKVNRKLTLDYGMRYDLQPSARELWRRTSMFSPGVANPNAGGLPGATIYEGSGPGRCNCTFTKTYPWAFAPRLGVAYQITEKTVLRAGWGFSYGQAPGFNYIGGGNSQGMGFNSIPFNAPQFGDPGMTLRDGFIYDQNVLYAASYDPGLRVTPGTVTSATSLIDPNGGRPSRVNQWNIGIQREIGRNLVVEAAYVGNRGAWFQANGLVDYNAVSIDRLRSFGLDVNNAEDRALLAAPLSSPQVQARGFKAPYAGFPSSATLAQSLRPFPQFTGIGSMWAPLGSNWYDSLQVKATKRFSAGLEFTAAYTWSKNLTTAEDQDGTTVPVNDVFNRKLQKAISRVDQPHVFVTSFNYEVPYGRSLQNAFLRQLASGWMINGVLRYGSGLPIRVPLAQNNLNASLLRSATTFANRAPGQPLFTKDPNCGCIDPNKDFVLNPAAWSDPAAGQFGAAAAYYSDYRWQRRFDEQISFGKMFRIHEAMRLQFRAEFFNIFNHTYLDVPESGNALAVQRSGANGVPVSGFGRVNSQNIPAGYGPRSGQIVARFQF